MYLACLASFFFSSRRRHTRFSRDWSSDVCSSDLDTDMTRGFDIPKASRQSVARAIFEGLENGEDEIFPDPMAASMAESWCGGAAKTLERQNAALLEGLPVAR